MSAQASPAPEKKKKNGKRKLVLIASIVALLAAGGGGAWWYSQSQAQAAAAAKPKAAATRAPAQYFALTPAFVVNLADADAVRYLQADVQLMTRDAATLAALETHAPALRNRLLLLFGNQSVEQIAERRGKEKLQQQALTEVRAVLKAEGAPDKVEALYFTSLVTQ